MQKLINILALTSFVVSAGVVGAGAYVYLNREALIDNVEQQIKEGIKGALPGALGSGLSPAPTANTGPVAIPVVPFGG